MTFGVKTFTIWSTVSNRSELIFSSVLLLKSLSYHSRLMAISCFYFCLLALIQPHILAAAPLIKPAPYARHLTTVDGLNLGEVKDIMQDRRGYLWMGTTEGLVRFDGTTAKRFSHNKLDAHSLSHNVVHGIAQDKNGNIWISTFGGGLNKLDPHTEQFSKIDLTLDLSDEPVTDKLYNLAIDWQNTLWIGSVNGMIRLDINSEKALALDGALGGLPKKLSSFTLVDSQGHLWFTTVSEGLYWFDGQTLRQFIHDKNNIDSLSGNSVRSVHQDNTGTLWISTSKGLNKFNPKSQTFTRYTPSDTAGFSHFDNDIFAIQSDDRGRLWLGTVLTGVHYFDIASGQFQPVSGQPDLNNQFKRNRVNKTARNKDGSIWFATVQGAIVIPQTALKIDYLTNTTASLKTFDIKQLDDNKVGFIADFNYYQLALDNLAIEQRFDSIVRPYRVKQAVNGDMWFATIGGNAQVYTAKTDTISHFDRTSFTGDIPFPPAFFSLFIDSNGFVWMTPLTEPPKVKGGVIRVDPANNQFKILPTAQVFNENVQIDTDNWLLASTKDGLYSLNTKTQTLSSWVGKIDNLPSRILTVLYDSQGTLWVGTVGQGLARLAPGAKSFEYFTTDNGLLSNGVVSIVEDDHEQLWLGTPVGLTRFDIKTSRVMNIEHQDGLLFAKFYKRSATKLDNGKIMMGTYGGLVMFDPLDLAVQNKPVTITVNDFKRFNQPVALRLNDQTSPLIEPIAFTDKLQLSYQDYVFSFGFSALELLRPDLMEYAWKMEGMDDKWVYSDAKTRQASFTTLPARDYVFRVKARKGNGPWSNEETTINITISPPWWRHNFAVASYVLVILFSIYWFIRQRTQMLVSQAKVLEENVVQRTHQLQASRDELAEKSQAVSDLLAQKQRLFASVSHEFRTPLTLILSPVDSLLNKYIDQPWAKELTLIKRNGRRLLRMVDQLLEFAKLEQQVQESRETVSLLQTLSIISASFERLVESKQISLTVNPFEDVNLTVLPDSLNKILINLLSNAFKYTLEQGAIQVDVSTVKGQVGIAVSDSGIGIRQTDQQAIFERFNRATHDHGEAIAGAGIGLSLVKELIEANDGYIQLKSEPGVGSTFTIYLPVSDETPTKHAAVLAQELELEVDSVSQNVTLDTIEEPHQQGLKTILVIDDNADMRNLLQSELQGDYQCLLADNGKVGLDLASEQMPDMVISDIMMPVMDGYELTEKLKANPVTSHIPVILLTAKGSTESRIKGLELLVDDYLAKPFNVQELRLRIRNILAIRDDLRQRFASAIDNSAPPPTLVDLGMNEVDQKFLDSVNEVLAEHYEDPEFNAKTMYRKLAISERQLHRKLTALFNLNFPELVRNFRLNKSITLLQQGHRVSSIYYSVGFSSHSYLTSCFKTKFGQTPKAYQSGLKGDDS
jgi:signal transduction histidine kinase/ligand-binding sensor domain-containing protein/DNA-binding NarL/FixJ family response regulator